LQISILRVPDKNYIEYLKEIPIEYRLLGIKCYENGIIEECPVEHLLLLKEYNYNIPPNCINFASTVHSSCKKTLEFTEENILNPLFEKKKKEMNEKISQSEKFIIKGFRFQEAELLLKRNKIKKKIERGNKDIQLELENIKQLQSSLNIKQRSQLKKIHREFDLINPGKINFIAHALVIPSNDPEDKKKYDKKIEDIAVRIAWGFEESHGGNVKDVSTPTKAKKVGFDDWPGFDLLSKYKNKEDKYIEVKGRARIGEVELSENEWAKACIHHEKYWLYVVFNCATSNPELKRINDPFLNILVRAKGGVIIDQKEIFKSAEKD
jgi:hypothetical protein